MHTAAHFARYPLPDQLSLLPRIRALFDFDAHDEHELCFSKGDEMMVLQERTDGWLWTVLNGLTGLVPSNHIEWLSPHGAPDTVKPQVEKEMQPVEGAVPAVGGAGGTVSAAGGMGVVESSSSPPPPVTVLGADEVAVEPCAHSNSMPNQMAPGINL